MHKAVYKFIVNYFIPMEDRMFSPDNPKLKFSNLLQSIPN